MVRCIITAVEDPFGEDLFAVELDGEQIEADLTWDEVGETVASAIEDGDLESDDAVVVVDNAGGRTRRRAIAVISPARRRKLGYALGAQPSRGMVQSDLDDE